MTSTELAIARLAKAQSTAAAVNELVSEESRRKVAADSRSTVAARKAKLRQALDSYDVDRLLELQATMTAFVDLVTETPFTAEGELVLDGDRAATLMKRYLDQREINELVTVVKDLIREAVFAHFDAMGRAEGLEDPENHNGTLEVPEWGKKFCREGTGYQDPKFNEVRLEQLLGEQRWAQICTEEVIPEQVIPEHVERNLSVEKALEMGRRDPEVMEILRDCLTPGAPKPPKLMVRDL